MNEDDPKVRAAGLRIILAEMERQGKDKSRYSDKAINRAVTKLIKEDLPAVMAEAGEQA